MASVHFGNVNVQGIEINSGIFIGDNRQNFWNTNTKSNTGFGTAVGQNIAYQPINVVIDPDVIDHQTIWK